MDFQPFLDYTVLGYPIAPIFIAASIALLGILLKNVVTTLLLKPLRTINKLSSGDTLEKIADLAEAPLRLSVVFAGLYIASHWLHTPKMEPFIHLLFKSFLTFIIFWVLFRMVDKFSTLFNFFSAKVGKEINEDIQNFLTKTLRILVIALGVMAILQEWGINVSAFVASLGLGGLAFALAAKDTVANLFGSLVIFSDRPFQVGDWVETPNVDGTIEEIGIRSTKIRNHAQALVSVPNAVMANTTITNWSRMGKRRVRTRIGLTYSTSAEQMQAVVTDIKAMLANHPDIHQEVILVYFDEFEASALSILLNFFTNTIVTAEYLHVRQDVNMKIMQIVAHHGAQFAFPSQSLYVESLPKQQLK